MSETDWNREAAAAACSACDQAFSLHRGVSVWRGKTVIFGNDGYRQDERTQIEVSVIRQYLDEMGVAELGFGVDDRSILPDGTPVDKEDRGYSWAMIIDCPESRISLEMLRKARSIACETGTVGHRAS